MATSPRRMRSVTNFSPPLIVSSVCIRHSTNQEQSRKAALNDMYLQRVHSLHQLAQSSIDAVLPDRKAAFIMRETARPPSFCEAAGTNDRLASVLARINHS